MTTIWHGTLIEACDLEIAIGHNCQCAYDAKTRERATTCPAHAQMRDSQRWLDGLLFMRNQAARLMVEEFTTDENRI